MPGIRLRSTPCLLLFLVFTCLVFFAPKPAEADHINSLEDLIREALENNREVILAQMEKEEAGALVEQARAGRSWRGDLLLEVDREKTPSYLETMYSIAGEEVGASYSSYSGTLALSTVFGDRIEYKAPLEKARLARDEAYHSLKKARYSVTEETLEAALNLFQARDGVTLAQKALENREQALKRVEIEKEEGTAVSRDVREAELEVEEASSTLNSARRMLELARDRVVTTTGLEKEEVQNIPDPQLPDIGAMDTANPWPWDRNIMQEMALKNRPEVEMSQLGIDLAQIELDEARRSIFEFQVGGSYSSPERNFRAGLEMSSDLRVTGTLTHFDTTLPQVEGIEIDEQEWEDFKEAWSWKFPPDWFPEKEDLEELLSFDTELEDEWQVEARIQINLFDSGLRRAQIEEKESALEQAHTRHQEAREGIELKINSLYAEMEDKFNTLQQAHLEYSFARQRYQETEKMVDAGVATTAEKELAQLNMIRREKEMVEKLFNYELAKVNLGAALGLEIDLFLASLSVK